jgi:hypothetical protein
MLQPNKQGLGFDQEGDFVMRRNWITLVAAVSTVFSQAGCLFVPDNEGILTFNYLILHEDAPGVVGVLLCDNPKINNNGSIFVKSPVARILVTGVSRRGLEVQRIAECFYDLPVGGVDSEQELGALAVKFPADTYQSFKLQMITAQGTPVTWANDPGDNFVQENEILGGLTVNLIKEQTLDLGPTIEQLGQDGVVADELKIFVKFPGEL